jgi:transcriptional regulator with XRE-family HTH domain
LPFCHVTLTAPKPSPVGYPLDPNSLGEHLKKKRIDSGLLQKDVTNILNVCQNSIISWELGKTYPALKFMPRIINYLGYLPFSEGDDVPLGEQLTTYRQIHGISQIELAKQLHVNPDTIRRWKHGISSPSKSNHLALSLVLEKPLAEKLRLLRQLSGVTQREYARQFGVGRCTLGKWERGVSHPPEHIVEKVATLLNTEYRKRLE